MKPNKERKNSMYGIKGIGIAMLLVMMIAPAFPAQDPSALLEKAIYTEETLGKLNDAIAIYKQIMNTAEMNREIGSMAIYRLGMCYRKLGSETDALSTFTALAKLYPEQRNLIVKSLILNMIPAPWADGEVMRLSQKRIGTESAIGAAFGTYSVESGLVDGKPVWYLRYLFGGARSPIYYSVATADAETMIPISSRFVRNETNLEAKFTPNKIEVVNLKDGSQPARQIPSTGGVYDAWQMIPIMRRLPLQPGFEATVPVFESSSGTFANVRFQVTSRETITVPAGTFDCHKVVMVSDDGLPNEQTFWITADSHAYVAKAHIDRINEFELHSVDVVGNDQSAVFEIPGGGYSLTSPRQWYMSGMYSISRLSPTGTIVNAGNAIQIGAPDLNSELSMMTYEVTSELPSPAKTPDSIKQDINGVEYRFQVRTETRERVTIAGLTGERFIADTLDIQSGEDVVQYRYNLSSPAKAYIFTFQTGKSSFDKMKASFESIMSSLRVK